ncbi:metallophosphoesterase family protein [Actinocrispum wychmicini]|uniref:Icc-related predicted phosphoesterase n=1 Tax=Actinocrispum wychmicini TaxID=1213861 RepID=A0A4R2JHS0_9PSEU|nr:metallophosphoesterase [Actinocrispum wychmicini]TCO58624.1 Icc-related predicted phosphoesterase [Actinocrispum wychmicini]
MPKVLTVSDEVIESLWTDQVRHHSVDLVLAAGDLPFDYLEYLASALERPCVLVPGNHDADLSGYARVRGMWVRSGFPARWPGPQGWVDTDGRIVDVAGLRIAGLGGSIRYNEGPNQWTERQQARRVKSLARAAQRRYRRDGRGVDVLLTHAPPLGVGDRPDPPHQGFACLHDAVRRIQPAILLHGHIHPHGEHVPDRRLNGTQVINTVGYKVLDITPGGGGAV